MKVRIISLFLALAVIVSAVPLWGISASAANIPNPRHLSSNDSLCLMLPYAYQAYQWSAIDFYIAHRNINTVYNASSLELAFKRSPTTGIFNALEQSSWDQKAATFVLETVVQVMEQDLEFSDQDLYDSMLVNMLLDQAVKNCSMTDIASDFKSSLDLFLNNGVKVVNAAGNATLDIGSFYTFYKSHLSSNGALMDFLSQLKEVWFTTDPNLAFTVEWGGKLYSIKGEPVDRLFQNLSNGKVSIDKIDKAFTLIEIALNTTKEFSEVVNLSSNAYVIWKTVDDSAADFLVEVRNQTDNPRLKKAIEKYIGLISDNTVFGFIKTVVHNLGEGILEIELNALATVFSAILADAFPAYGAAVLIYAVFNATLNVKEKVDSLYAIRALHVLDEAVVAAMKVIEANCNSSKFDKNGNWNKDSVPICKAYVTGMLMSFRLLSKELGYASEYLEAWYGTDGFNKHFGNDDAWSDWEATIALLKNTLTNQKLNAFYTEVKDEYFDQENVIVGGYKISYKLNGGTGNINDTIKPYNTAISLTETKPVKEGETFLGWINNDDCYSSGFELEPSLNPCRCSKELVFTAHWAKQNTVMFNANGGNGAPAAVENLTGTITIPETKPTLTGYTFAGWSDDSKDTDGEYYQPNETIKVNGSLILYAIWDAGTFDIVFHANGGKFADNTETKTMQKQYLQPFTVDPGIPTRDGHIFAGKWSLNETGTAICYDHGKSYNDIGGAGLDAKHLYAVWNDGTADILYDYGDDPACENVTTTTDEVDISNGPVNYSIKGAAEMQSYNGNSFKGWIHQEPDGELWWANAWADNGKYKLYQPGNSITVSGDDVFYAKWTWFVHYDMGEEQYIHAEVGNNSMYTIAAPTCEKEGKVFVRWEYVDANGATVSCQPGEQIFLYSDLYLTAVWRDAGHSISGTVKDATVNGINYGKPIEGAIVEFFDSTGASVGAVLTDAEGVFSFEFMKKDTYQYSFVKPGYKSVTIDSLIINENTPSMGIVTMVEDANSLIVDGGKCGDLAVWILSTEYRFSSTYDLSIVGAGDIYDYENNSDTPWKQYEYNIQDLTVEDSITRIGESAFEGNYGDYSSEVYLSKNLISIGAYAFAYSGFETDIILPESLEVIENSAFGDSRITGIFIPKRTHTIGYYSSSGNNNNPFMGCQELLEIQVDAENPNFCSKDGVLYTKDMTTLIAYPLGKEVDSLTIPETVGEIYRDAFAPRSIDYCHLKKIFIPSKINNLYAFEMVPVEQFIVNDNNPYYCSVDGVIYSKDRKTLELYPGGNTASQYSVLEGTEIIGSQAFWFCNNLITLNLPDGLTKIDGTAIQNCFVLSNLVIPDSVTYLGSYALSSCNSLSDIYFMGDVPQYFYNKAIYPAFNNNITLHYIEGKAGWISPTINKGGISFKTSAFNPDKLDLSVVKSGTCGEGITWTFDQDGVLAINGQGAITDYSYYNNTPWYTYCDVITKIVINDGITSIGNYAFDSCEQLESISLSNSIMSIGENAFCACPFLKSIVLPNKLQTIGSNAFMQCEGLTSIDIPNSVTSIGAGAFYNCGSLVSVTLPDKLKTIEDDTFNWCTSLVAIKIPQSVRTIGKSAFYGCKQLLSIIVPDGVVSIYDEAFLRCGSLKHIDLPESVTTIGNRVFEGCESLTDVVLPEHLNYLGDYAFCDCEQLSDIVVPGGLDSIKHHTFVGCSNLKSVIIEDGIKSIENDAFSHCASLENVNLPSTLNYIGDWSFWSCSNLRSIVLPEGLTTIGEHAFGSCSSLESIVIPASVQLIGNSAFTGTDNLKSIFFCGDVPADLGFYALGWDGTSTIYYVPGTSGWTTPTWRSPSDGTLFDTATWKPKRDTAITKVNVTGSKNVICTLDESATDVELVVVGAYEPVTNKFIGAATGEYSGSTNTVTVSFAVSLPEKYELKVFCTDDSFAPLYRVSTFSQNG